MHHLQIIFSILVFLMQDLPEKNSIVSSGSSIEAPSMACDRRSDSLELVKFYNATGGPNWWKKWDFKEPIDTWWGLSVNTEGCVSEIILSDTLPGHCCDGNNLTNQLIVLNLPSLTYLNLWGNKLTGSIPNLDFPSLQTLRLEVNQFSGNIPNFDKLPNLGYLALEGNKLTGSLPSFDKMPKLYRIGVYSGNQLSGPIPNFNLPELNRIHFGGNRFSGPLPLFDKTPNLVEINLDHNEISGTIPSFNKLPLLRSFNLSFNLLSGPIPDFSKNPLLENCLLNDNLLTFDDLIANARMIIHQIEVIRGKPGQFIYAPQQYIYSDTIITISTNTNYTLDLLIDDTVTTSTYTWYKNDVPYKTIKGSNKLSFTPFTSNDAGTYTVKITNPLAPQLTLESRSIHLNPSSSEQDCSNARVLNISPCLPAITIDSISGPGNQNDEADNSCLDFNNSDPRNNKSEKNSQWFKWTASDNSNLTFIIKPKLTNADIDFSLFELIDGIDGCTTKRMIRCNGTACLGPTGLKESSTDIEESPNCDPGEDGFLKALQQIPESSYALLINNFTNNSGYTIEFNPQIIVLNPDHYKGNFQTEIEFKVLANDSFSNNRPLKVNIESPFNGYIEYNHSTGEGKFKPDKGYSGKETVNYTVCPIDCPSNCQNSTIEFEVASKCSDRNSIVLPNILFPNGPSGTNRYFIVEAIKNCPDAFGPKPHKLQVFNRWGGEVYRNNNYLNDWDGTTSSGQPLPAGTYYYLLDLGSIAAPLRGYVVIMR